MDVQFGKTASDYGTHRAGFPDPLFARLADFGIGRPGQALLDLGTGTGSLARGFALRGAAVTGLDPSADMLAKATELDRAAGAEVAYREGRAEATGLPGAAFDVVTAGQCWHWFDAPAAAAEVRRLLRPGGLLAICHFDWIPLAGNVVEATETLIRSYNPDWGFHGGTGVHGWELKAVAEAGFANLEILGFDHPVAYSHEAWRGRIRASAGVGASLPPDRVAAFDADHAALLTERFPDDPLEVPHRVFALIAQR